MSRLIDLRDLLYRILIKYVSSLYKESLMNAVSLSLATAVSYDPELEKEKKREQELFVQALMLPLPIKDIKIEDGKVVVELGETENSGG
ncbi:MAG: hypothetical protein QXE70_10345 [Ignisphaera sp.]